MTLRPHPEGDSCPGVPHRNHTRDDQPCPHLARWGTWRQHRRRLHVWYYGHAADPWPTGQPALLTRADEHSILICTDDPFPPTTIRVPANRRLWLAPRKRNR